MRDQPEGEARDAGQDGSMGAHENLPQGRENAQRHMELEMPTVVRPVRRYSQQQLQRDMDVPFPEEQGSGEYYCLPVAFYELAAANGYATARYGSHISLYMADVDRADRDRGRGWSRPAMSRQMRFLFDGMPVVSWQTGRNTQESLTDDSLVAMQEAGYLYTNQEVDFFRDSIVDHDISEIVGAGYPVMATVQPGFGANAGDHTIIIDGWGERGVHVVDSDDRNPYSLYGPEYVREYLGAACTVVPPQNESAWPGMKDWKEAKNSGSLRLDRSQ